VVGLALRLVAPPCCKWTSTVNIPILSLHRKAVWETLSFRSVQKITKPGTSLSQRLSLGASRLPSFPSMAAPTPRVALVAAGSLTLLLLVQRPPPPPPGFCCGHALDCRRCCAPPSAAHCRLRLKEAAPSDLGAAIIRKASRLSSMWLPRGEGGERERERRAERDPSIGRSTACQSASGEKKVYVRRHWRSSCIAHCGRGRRRFVLDPRASTQFVRHTREKRPSAPRSMCMR
jgi:hypothetical protein